MDNTEAKAPREVNETGQSTPSFQTQLTEVIEGQRVRVEAADGKRFEGTLEAISLNDRHVLLRDIEELPGGVTSSSAFVAEVDWIVPVDDEPEQPS